MERSSTIFAVSSNLHDNPHNRSRYHRAAGTPTAQDSSMSWRHAASTYAWIVEQELAAMSREVAETRRWVFEQQVHFGLLPKSDARRTTQKRRRDAGPGGQETDETARLGERSRAARRDAERDRLQRDFEQMEARWRERPYREERRRRQDRQRPEDRKATEKQKQGERRRQEEAWKTYERRWATIVGEGGSLRFKSIPWPTVTPPRDVGEITAEAVARFILSPAHSEGVSRRDRIKGALRRWHPDRFGRLLNRVKEKDRGAVERGVGIVARCLNDLLAKEK
ncbi:hypothetical protein BC834DRAFT_648356 [Gloeopeniophorella convolvens]|nr:hypothetical protein BC834DRAFT_648356 [Gloeopeniophorella convolvens]